VSDEGRTGHDEKGRVGIEKGLKELISISFFCPVSGFRIPDRRLAQLL